MDLTLRADLREAQSQAWAALGAPDSSWTGAQRVELAGTALDALSTRSPLPPWVAPSTVDGALPASRLAPDAAHDVVYRVARHASTLTHEWYVRMTDQLGEIAYVELVALTCQVAAVWSLHRGVGRPLPPLPDPVPGAPTRHVAPDLARPRLNWVPVAAPADERAAVVQAFSAVPDTNARTWVMADAQYMPDLEMVHPDWTRGPLSRAQMEVVAMTVSRSRECFY